MRAVSLFSSRAAALVFRFSRLRRAQRSRARALSLLNLKKKRGYLQSNVPYSFIEQLFWTKTHHTTDTFLFSQSSVFGLSKQIPVSVGSSIEVTNFSFDPRFPYKTIILTLNFHTHYCLCIENCASMYSRDSSMKFGHNYNNCELSALLQEIFILELVLHFSLSNLSWPKQNKM